MPTKPRDFWGTPLPRMHHFEKQFTAFTGSSGPAQWNWTWDAGIVSCPRRHPPSQRRIGSKSIASIEWPQGWTWSSPNPSPSGCRFSRCCRRRPNRSSGFKDAFHCVGPFHPNSAPPLSSELSGFSLDASRTTSNASSKWPDPTWALCVHRNSRISCETKEIQGKWLIRFLF